MLLKATEQCFNTLERAEMLLLLLRRFPETVVQHGVRVAHNKHFVCLFRKCNEYSMLLAGGRGGGGRRKTHIHTHRALRSKKE